MTTVKLNSEFNPSKIFGNTSTPAPAQPFAAPAEAPRPPPQVSTSALPNDIKNQLRRVLAGNQGSVGPAQRPAVDPNQLKQLLAQAPQPQQVAKAPHAQPALAPQPRSSPAVEKQKRIMLILDYTQSPYFKDFLAEQELQFTPKQLAKMPLDELDITLTRIRFAVNAKQNRNFYEQMAGNITYFAEQTASRMGLPLQGLARQLTENPEFKEALEAWRLESIQYRWRSPKWKLAWIGASTIRDVWQSNATFAKLPSDLQAKLKRRAFEKYGMPDGTKFEPEEVPDQPVVREDNVANTLEEPQILLVDDQPRRKMPAAKVEPIEEETPEITVVLGKKE